MGTCVALIELNFCYHNNMGIYFLTIVILKAPQQHLSGDFPTLGVPFWGPFHKDFGIWGSIGVYLGPRPGASVLRIGNVRDAAGNLISQPSSSKEGWGGVVGPLKAVME